MDTRREFLKKSILLSGAAGLSSVLPSSIQRAFAINPAPGSTYLDAEHVVILMQENRSFDHCFGALQGVRGFNDPRAIMLADKKPVWLQSDAAGHTYAPFRLNIQDTKATWMGSLPHSRMSQVDAYNSGKYDQWLIAKQSGHEEYADMPLTLGYYNREDLPFNYALADAFTVCDQNFCSAMTSTTPNRSFFWTGKITSQEDGWVKANLSNSNYKFGKVLWPTFPELLQEHNVNWKFYQNDVYCGGGLTQEERDWLLNFGCNILEFWAAYNVKFSSRYLQTIQDQVNALKNEIDALKEKWNKAATKDKKKIQTTIAKKQYKLKELIINLSKWSSGNFDKLSTEEKGLYQRAFVTNAGDPDYRNLTELEYNDGGEQRKVVIPKGDPLYQFRKDVNDGKLPTVSWLASPKYFSDHPTVPWYGSWYVSEVLDILTKNPEVWKKTIFILTYDENDGYFDHIPPFSVPDPKKAGTGKCSAGIDPEVEYVRLENELKRGISKEHAREAPIGLGFRVPMIIASPWSRGGKVCSQLFDHTSTLQFLETFLNDKFKKNIRLDNISPWRRTICGNLTSAFSPYDSKTETLPFLQKNKTVENIYNAKFKQIPSGYTKLTQDDIDTIVRDPFSSVLMPKQESGIRPACALPYELYADGQLNKSKDGFEITFAAGNRAFGTRSSGSPFIVYAPEKFYTKEQNPREEKMRNWQYAVSSGDQLSDTWTINDFENTNYHLQVHGPNGFFREYKGDAGDPEMAIKCEYERIAGKLTGNIYIHIARHHPDQDYTIEVIDHGYNKNRLNIALKAKNKEKKILISLEDSFGWYDFSIRAQGFDRFEKRYAGRVENGKTGYTDPVMGRVDLKKVAHISANQSK